MPTVDAVAVHDRQADKYYTVLSGNQVLPLETPAYFIDEVPMVGGER